MEEMLRKHGGENVAKDSMVKGEIRELIICNKIRCRRIQSIHNIQFRDVNTKNVCV